MSLDHTTATTVCIFCRTLDPSSGYTYDNVSLCRECWVDRIHTITPEQRTWTQAVFDKWLDTEHSCWFGAVRE